MSADSQGVRTAAQMALAVKRFKEERPDAGLLNADPIAIVGIGCRFPGNVRTPEECWRVFADGIDTITDIPGDRWAAATYYDPDPIASGKTNSRWGGFIPDADLFDPELFGISPREAASVDPQQRLLLEVAWEAILDSGRAPESLAGTRTGVFVGICLSDYERMAVADASSISVNTCTGAYRSVASGRISYLLDLRGPSVAVDTACSSSLVAVHDACRSLRAGESDLALAGGVTLHLLPEHYVGLARLGMLSANGRCKPFDASADGFVPSEGCGLVILKRLSDALADGDRIYAVIRGSAVNQDGRTNSLTAPNGLAQQDVVAAALRNGQVPPSSVSYVETHGTGTVLGDPIEVEALAAVLGENPCVLGAAKSNFGHLEAAAGVVGLIKAALALHKETIPANLHFKKLNPHISLEGTRFCIPSRPTPWPRGAVPRFAGVSSFGFSGTNAHVVLEEAPHVPAWRTKPSEKVCCLLISARTSEALHQAVRGYRDFLAANGKEIPLYDICHSAALRRSHYEERAAITATTHDEMAARMEDFLEGRRGWGIACARASGKAESLVFVCSGQGSQWPRMGISLLKTEPIFRAALEECETWIRHWAGWSLLDLLESESKLAQTEFAQPAIFAIQVALVRLFGAWGVKPAAVIGHSVGEVAAAYIAGALSLTEAVRVVVQRGRVMQASSGKGKMAVVRMTASAVFQDLATHRGAVSIAAINSPQSTVVSGDCAAIDALLASWTERGVGCVLLPVNYAFHSARMQPFEAELVRVLGPVETHPESIPILSTVLGKAASGGEFNGAYWGRNVRRPVQFAAAMDAAYSRGFETFVEIGPHPVLLTAIRECLPGRVADVTAVASLRKDHEERTGLVHSLGVLHCAGYPVSWKAIYSDAAPAVALPAYPYQKQRYWLDEHTPRNIYELEWRPMPRGKAARSANGLWVVVGEDRISREELAAALNQRGIAAKADDVAGLLRSGSGCQGVIWLANHRPEAAMSLAQELIRRHSSEPPQLWLVTKGATSASDETSLSQALVWGMFRSVAIEHPELCCVRADLDSASPRLPELADEVAAWDGEQEIAFRDGARLVPRVTRKSLAKQQGADLVLRAKATYLITGGMGALGLSAAEWLTRKGARNFVLMGRRGLSPDASRTVDALRKLGARIEIRLADVANFAQMTAIVEEIQREMPPLGGVLHAAGVLDDGVFLEQTWERAEKVMAPKAAGAWNLHQLTADKPLDFFVLFSSLAAVTGSPGQSGYAAANAYLDALAHYRHSRGLPALSVNWGAWAGSGMAAQVEESGRRRVLRGIRPMEAERCFAALESVMAQNRSQVVIAEADWSQWNPAPRLLSELIPQNSAQSARTLEDGILSRLEAAAPASRRKILVDYLRGQANTILGLNGSGPHIDERQPLFRMGMDSLMAVEFRNLLSSALDRPLSATLIFDHPTIGALADFLDAAPASDSSPEPLLEELEDLSDAQAEELLKAELERT